MHIILGDQITKELAAKYIVLELDTFLVPGRAQAIPSFCLVENVPIEELPQANQFQDLHGKMIKNYREGNWKFCEDALEHLMGRWNGELDTFYQELQQRLVSLTEQDRAAAWDPAIKI